jgi:transcription initiation factor IIF auxiliary subunit
MKNLTFATYSRLLGKRSDQERYAWCVYLHETDEQLKKIREVEYTLHPTFPNPVRNIIDREHCFPLLSDGWGAFSIRIRVISIDGDLVRASHMLTLEKDNWPRGKRPVSFKDDDTKRVYEALIAEKWEWRKVSTISKVAKTDTKITKQILSELCDQRACRKAYFASPDGSELWGATEVVGLLPTPRS